MKSNISNIQKKCHKVFYFAWRMCRVHRMNNNSWGVFHKDLSALRVVLKVKIYNNYIEQEISLVDYTQCAASACDLSNAITRHKPRATWDLSMTLRLSALKSL